MERHRERDDEVTELRREVEAVRRLVSQIQRLQAGIERLQHLKADAFPAR
ncbi:MAG: hypothetical protein HY217_01390 [Candidatus Rokubacteria bacterium]|nr:hypothetical protein [Candidatus Rokubacteria bacterium]